VEMDGAARSHHNAFGLKEGPFAIGYPYAVIIYCRTKNGLSKTAFCRC
jgi:hypothetical protein